MNKEHIELYFYNLLRGNSNIHEFEKWIYDIDEELIDEHFGSGFYFELVSLNYRNKYVINELEKILFNKISKGRFEEIKIKDILKCVIEEKGDLTELTDELYDLYCNGYLFLRDIGLSYAFHCIPREQETYNFDEKSRINLRSEAQRIRSFLDSGKIVIIGENEYEDYRKEEEKIELHDLENMYIAPKVGIIQRVIDKIRRAIR